MRKIVAFAVVFTSVASLWWVRASTQEDRPTWESKDGQAYVRLPEFVWEALSSPAARKAGLWIGSDGQILRYTVHVDRRGVPDWVHAMADERLGRGEDVDYELEIYPDGSQVYEVYRKIDGLERQLSVTTDRSVYYLGTEHPVDKLPEAVATAARGLNVVKCVLKEGPGVAEYHLKATRDGLPCRVRVSKAGRVIATQREIPAVMEVPLAR